MKTQFIYFDLVGTLIEKKEVGPIIQNILADYDYQVDLHEIQYKQKLLLENNPCPEETNAEFYSKFNAKLLTELQVEPKKEIIDLMYKSLKKLEWSRVDFIEILNNLPCSYGIVSNFDSRGESLLEKLLPFDFAEVVFSYQVNALKPDDEIYQVAIARAELEPENITMVGDSLRLDVNPALKNGMNTVLIDTFGIYDNYEGVKINSLNNLIENLV